MIHEHTQFQSDTSRAFAFATQDIKAMPRELAQFKRESASLRRELPNGEGHPVIIIPGFGAAGIFYISLVLFLDRLGYNAQSWDQGFNLGYNEQRITSLVNQVKKMSDKAGKRTILKGHSLGGVFANMVAKKAPDDVHSVDTFGSPLDIRKSAGSTPATLQKLHHCLNPESSHLLEDEGFLREIAQPAPNVPITSYYSLSDNVVDWQASQLPNTKLSRSIEVLGTHVGMPFIPDVLRQSLGQKPSALRAA